MPELDSLFILPPDNPPDAEIRQLKLTIAALRQALEEGAAARDELSRTIRAGYDSAAIVSFSWRISASGGLSGGRMNKESSSGYHEVTEGANLET